MKRRPRRKETFNATAVPKGHGRLAGDNWISLPRVGNYRTAELIGLFSA
jgi:hypothetical protein